MSVLQNHGPNGGPYGDILVSVFSNVASAGGKGASAQERSEQYMRDVEDWQEMTAWDALHLGAGYLPVINEIRSCNDEERIRYLKRFKLPAMTLSAFFITRDSKVEMEKKMRRYNSLIVLDFDHLDDPEQAKELLSRFPHFWYIGLSVSGKGLFGIVPIGTSDWKMHKVYFAALEKEMRQLGFTVDTSCKDVTRLRIVSYDENPYVNPECK